MIKYASSYERVVFNPQTRAQYIYDLAIVTPDFVKVGRRVKTCVLRMLTKLMSS